MDRTALKPTNNVELNVFIYEGLAAVSPVTSRVNLFQWFNVCFPLTGAVSALSHSQIPPTEPLPGLFSLHKVLSIWFTLKVYIYVVKKEQKHFISKNKNK